MKIATYAGTKALLEKYGHKPRKSLGQNFLIDQHVLQKIIRAANFTFDDMALEIGPGLGGLTQAAAQHVKKLLAVELDKHLAECLRETFADTPNIEVIQSDILDYPIPPQVTTIIANLPYYVTTPIIMHLLENYHFKSIIVMVQKEVAQRMTGHGSYGALTLAIEYHAKAEIVANVPANCFYPRPQVGSAVVRLDVLEKPPVTTDHRALFANIKAGFGQRRKTLANSLHGAEIHPHTKDELIQIIKSQGLSENVRGEALSLAQWAALTEALLD